MDNDVILVTHTGFSQTLNIADNPQKTRKYGSFAAEIGRYKGNFAAEIGRCLTF